MATAAQNPNPDDSQFFHVSLSKRVVHLALLGFQRYRPFLEQMRGIENDFGIEQSPSSAEMRKIDRIIKWCQERLTEMANSDFEVFGLIYGDLKWIKTGMILRINDLKAKRDTEFSKYSSLPVSVITAVNMKIAEYENLTESGLFNSMVPHLLTFESTMPAPVKVEIADAIAQDPKGPLFVMRVELLDEGLRRRCGDLYEQFAADSTHQDRFDTVLRDAAVVIESRIREAAGLPETLFGESLLAKTFATDTGELILSADKSEQKAVHNLFLGFFGFVRNSVNHRLVPTYTKERAAQVLGLADYLLFLISRSRRRNPPASSQSTTI